MTNLPIIIGGSHRSGTTLLRKLLNGHSNIFCPPEIKFHKDLLRQFPEDPLDFSRLSASMAELGLPEHIWIDEFGKALVRCMEMAAQQAGKTRWADKNPENAINIHHWHRLLGHQFHFILAIRHPLDIIASMTEVGFRRVLPADNLGKAAHVKKYIECGLDFIDLNPEISRIIRYEELVTDPAVTLTGLTEWLGEPFESSMISNLGNPYHGDGLGDPKARGRATISTDTIGRWRREIPVEEHAALKEYLAPLCDRLNYALDEGQG